MEVNAKWCIWYVRDSLVLSHKHFALWNFNLFDFDLAFLRESPI